MPQLSVVIPTWNEEQLIPALIQNLKCSPLVAEIIVADNDSEDRTAELAHQAGCLVVPGGRPACGRNAGAAVASEPLILFLDADVIITENAIEQILEKFSDESVNLVTCALVPLSDKRMIRVLYWVLDFYLRICNKIGINQGVGSVIAVRKSAFQRVRGFDENISAGEDAYFIRQVGSLVGGVRYTSQLRVAVSARRMELEPVLVFALKVAMWAALRLCGLRISIVPYRWARYRQEPGPDSTGASPGPAGDAPSAHTGRRTQARQRHRAARVPRRTRLTKAAGPAPHQAPSRRAAARPGTSRWRRMRTRTRRRRPTARRQQ